MENGIYLIVDGQEVQLDHALCFSKIEEYATLYNRLQEVMKIPTPLASLPRGFQKDPLTQGHLLTAEEAEEARYELFKEFVERRREVAIIAIACIEQMMAETPDVDLWQDSKSKPLTDIQDIPSDVSARIEEALEQIPLRVAEIKGRLNG